MPETTAVAPAPEPQPPQLTPAQQLAAAKESRLRMFVDIADAARVGMLKAKGLAAPSIQPTHDELVAMQPLEGDTMRYAKDKDGNPRLAYDKHGLLAFPKPKGRMHRHMTKHELAIKSEYLRISKRMMETLAGKLIKEAETKGEKFVGVPEEELPKIAAKAAVLAEKICKAKSRAIRRHLRRMQDANRRINYGLLPGNQVTFVVNRGGPYSA